MSDPDLDYERAEPTGRTTAIRAAGERGDVRFLAEEINESRKSVDSLLALENRRRGATWALRALAGIGISLAGIMGARALALANEAAIDHERLGSVIERQRAHEVRIDANGTSISAMQRDGAVSTAALSEVRATLVDLRDEVRTMRREAAERDRRR